MKNEIIPVILAKDFSDFKKKLAVIKLLRPKPKMIQIDVVDGKFAPGKTWTNPKQMMTFITSIPSSDKGKMRPPLNLPLNKGEKEGVIQVEIHLMVVNPLKRAREWLKAGAKRVLFHWEVFKNPPQSPFYKGGGKGDFSQEIKHFIKLVKSQGVEVGLCLNPETPISALEPYIKEIDYVLLLGVTPGRSGQKFQPQILKKITALRRRHPALPIEVDGGVKLDNATMIFKAGATRLSTASALINAENPQKAYQQFLKVIRSIKFYLPRKSA